MDYLPVACRLQHGFQAQGRLLPVGTFAPDSPFEQSFEVSPSAACEAGRRALLSQGYLIEESKHDAVRAKKFFQPDRSTQVQLTFSLFCLSEGDGLGQVRQRAPDARRT